MEFDIIGLFGKKSEQWVLSSEKKCNIVRFLDSVGKKIDIFLMQKKNVDKLDSRRWPVRPDHTTQCKYSENMCKLMPQCFQILHFFRFFSPLLCILCSVHIKTQDTCRFDGAAR